jgi:hypothetical protein
MSKYNINVDQDVDLDDFPRQDIIDYFGIESDQGSDETERTIRDEQYDEVLDQLKEKFSVAELEALLKE